MAYSSCFSSARDLMSSANGRLVIVLQSMISFPSYSSIASDMILWKKMLKWMVDRWHPCLTPTVVLNQFLCCHSSELHLQLCRRGAQWRDLDLH